MTLVLGPGLEAQPPNLDTVAVFNGSSMLSQAYARGLFALGSCAVGNTTVCRIGGTDNSYAAFS